MSFSQDKQIRHYMIFLVFFAIMTIFMGIVFVIYQSNLVKSIYISHDEAIASSLLEQGISKEIIAGALVNTKIDREGKDFLLVLGMGEQTDNEILFFLSKFQHSTQIIVFIGLVLLLIFLFFGTLVFFWRRKQLYLQAGKVIDNYINGDFSYHLPQNSEGAIFCIFAAVEQLATMLQAKSDSEHKAKQFLKNTISDISHQLKTPLAAMTMYQEIIADEPGNVKIVKEFSEKIGISLKRMEELIQSMLKLTRLDTGNIVFEKSNCRVTDLISRSISELTSRAESENKQIHLDGNVRKGIICDFKWTSEAIGNIVKNALDHTESGDQIYISWKYTPAMLRIFIADTGSGIAPEDIHHIFKRFYRSKHSLNTPGIGLGLSLAKSIIEGQGGLLSVKSELGEGTIFTVTFLTES